MRAVLTKTCASAVLLVFASAGLAASSTHASGSGTADRVIKDTVGGVLITIPSSWQRTKPSGAVGNLRQRLNCVAPGHPFWGITIASTPHNPNLTGAFSLAETKPLQEMARNLLSPNNSVSHLRIAASDDLVVGFAALVSYDVSVAGAPASSVRSYWVVSGGRLYVLAGATSRGQMAAHTAAFREIFSTFRPY